MSSTSRTSSVSSTPDAETPSEHDSAFATPLSPISSTGDAKIPTTRSATDTFTRWRPTYHIQAPSGWMNDPCAPGYDASTGTYHVSFQWNPNGLDWGDIAWGRAHSKDMIHWTVEEQPSISPDADYDCQGVFTGCQMPTTDGSLTYAYTSVNALPIHHTLTHARDSESLSLVRSLDGGETFEKIAGNPILPCEPDHLEVTGWRDPFVAPWQRMSTFLGRDSEKTLFGIISGGIRDVTPTTFLYAIDNSDLTKWEYIGPLADVGLNFRPSIWSGDLGVNWEVTNFVTLRDDEVERDFLIMGTEGCVPTSRSDTFGPARPARGQLWMAGSLCQPSPAAHAGPVEMSYDFGGYLDHGCLYAANGFFDSISQKQIVWGWITEEDLCDDLRHAQGWSGMLSMPREIRLQTIRHVLGATRSNLQDIASIETEREEGADTYTVRTLASQPYEPLIQALRQGPNVQHTSVSRTLLHETVMVPVASLQWELDARFNVSKGATRIGVVTQYPGGVESETTIVFEPATEIVKVTRPPLAGSNSEELINNRPEIAPHTLFTLRDCAGKEVGEELRIRAWRDNSVMEVFINERTAISTRLYGAESGPCTMRFFAEDHEGVQRTGSELITVEVWDGIGLS